MTDECGNFTSYSLQTLKGVIQLDGTFVLDDIVTILYSSWIPIPVREGTLKRFTIGGAC